MTSGASSVVAAVPAVSAAEREQVLAIDAQAEAVDGVDALDDQVRIDLAAAAAPARHLLARPPDGDAIVGYAHADLRAGDVVSGHVVVAPLVRRRGLGTALLRALTDAANGLPLRIWAHGNTPAARAMAKSHGFQPVRELRRMRRRLDTALPQPTYPPAVAVRTFVPGADDGPWVAVNAAAFADHPEQGRLGVDDLRQRVGQPWFDPAGFFLADRDGELLGYHWTKVHPTGAADGGPVGEVYVLGVHPDAQGLGLGKALTLTGLRHLRDLGLGEVMLYVESDNLPAIAVYERLGFTVASVDVMYTRR
ncbi:MAG: mycothiol synthase [Nocardioidaceae bacterium]|nr:mycothiol synthase [Nocardioidaceae bacterium]